MGGTCILGIVVCELGHGQESCLVVLLLIDKGLEICLHRTILSLYLAIYLRIKGYRQSTFYAEVVAKRKPEL